VVDPAGLGPGSTVLEVGCGTGQLTEQLAAHDLAATAIDIGATMIAAARRRAGSSLVSFEAVSFEAFGAPDACFDLIAFATAFRWIGSEVKFAKAGPAAEGCRVARAHGNRGAVRRPVRHRPARDVDGSR
jgi:ubiquinone/menaquinone biosynthesis C-methylase UbiE